MDLFPEASFERKARGGGKATASQVGEEARKELERRVVESA